jgi:hypothetical protein
VISNTRIVFGNHRRGPVQRHQGSVSEHRRRVGFGRVDERNLLTGAVRLSNDASTQTCRAVSRRYLDFRTSRAASSRASALDSQSNAEHSRSLGES